MKKLMMIVSSLVAALTMNTQPYLAGMLGVSTYAARRVIDAIMVGASIWTIAALILGGASFAALAWTLARRAISRFGRATAIAW